MKTVMKCMALFCLATLLATSAHAAGIVAKLVVPETKLLPGVPFEAWIELENQSTETIAVGLQPTLLATGPRGERFEARSRNDDFLLGIEYAVPPVHYLQMKAQERRTVPMALTMGGEPHVFSDVRVLYPGRYTIAVRLAEWRSNGEEIYSAPPPEYSGAIETNEVMIERIATGEDAVVWQRMQEVADGAWKLDDWIQGWPLINEIVDKHPTSNYVPYAMLAGAFMNEPRRQMEMLLATAERFPSSPVVEYLHYYVSGITHNIAEYDIGQREREICLSSKRPTIRLRVAGRAEFVKKGDTMLRY